MRTLLLNLVIWSAFTFWAVVAEAVRNLEPPLTLATSNNAAARAFMGNCSGFTDTGPKGYHVLTC